MAPSLLLIPPELQVTIIGNLDAKSIQRARGICREVRDLIDAHKTTLVKTIQSKESARLQAFIDYHDYRDLSIVQALSRWMKHRAVRIDENTAPCQPCVFMVHFMKSRDPTCGLASAEYHEIARLVYRLVYDHAITDFHHTADSEWTPGTVTRKLVVSPDYFAAMHAANFPSINEAHLRKVFEEAAAHTDLFELETSTEPLGLRERFRVGSALQYCPGFRLTKIRVGGPIPGWGITRGEFVRAQYRGGDKIPEVLHAPSLPPDRVFAYFASDDWAFTRILQAIAGIPLDPLLKAALLERLFIF